MWEKITLKLGKWGFGLCLVFGLLYLDPIANVFISVVGEYVLGVIRMAILCLFFVCVIAANDEVIANSEKQGEKLVKIALWFLNIMESIKGAIKTASKTKDDGKHT